MKFLIKAILIFLLISSTNLNLLSMGYPIREIVIDGTSIQLTSHNIAPGQTFDIHFMYEIKNPTNIWANLICASILLHFYQNPSQQVMMAINVSYAINPNSNSIYVFNQTRNLRIQNHVKQESLFFIVPTNQYEFNPSTAVEAGLRIAYNNFINYLDLKYPKCPGCNSTLIDSDLCKIKKCQHIFHKNCIFMLLRIGSNKCPKCSLEFWEDDIIYL